MKIIDTDNGFEVRTNKGRMSRAYCVNGCDVINVDRSKPTNGLEICTSIERAITVLLEHRLNEELKYAKFA